MSPLPFAGLRVLEFAHFWSAPYAAMYLASQGADVIKIESIQRPDAWRLNHTAPTLGEDWVDRGVMWQATNLGKRDLTLDAGSTQGQALIRHLCATADVFIENFASAVVERQGLGYEQLREINPAIIMVRAPGFGIDGPWRDYVGFGDVFEQVAGFAAVSGYPDMRPQTPGGYMDPIVGMHITTAVIAALEHREATGLGQLIEVPQSEVAMAMAAQILICSEMGSPLRQPGNRIEAFAPQGVYRCAGTTPAHIAISVRDDIDWAALVAVIGSEAIRTYADAGLAERRDAHDDIDGIIADWASINDAAEAAAHLQARGVPAAKLLRPADYNADPQLIERGYYQEVVHPRSGPRLYPTFPMHFSYQRDTVVHASSAPLLGEHNREILCGELGLSGDEFQALVDAKVIGTKGLHL